MSFITVFKIRNSKGLWCNGGYSATFTAKGKMWNSRGSLNSFISQSAKSTSGGTTHWRKVPDDWMIFEIVVDEDKVGTEGYTARVTTHKVNDFIAQMKRKEELSKKFNSNFATLVERIESKGQAEFQWALIAGGSWATKGEVEGLQDAIKLLKLKRNTDYSACIAGDGAAIAFKSKDDALRVRLSNTSKCQGVDIVNYLEFDN